MEMTKELPKISSYGQYASDNYGLNTLIVDLGTIRLYYSYQTIVAYWTAADGLVISKNQWSTTTGKHLSWIHPDKTRRIPYDEFTVKLQAAIDTHIQ